MLLGMFMEYYYNACRYIKTNKIGNSKTETLAVTDQK